LPKADLLAIELFDDLIRMIHADHHELIKPVGDRVDL